MITCAVCNGTIEVKAGIRLDSFDSGDMICEECMKKVL